MPAGRTDSLNVKPVRRAYEQVADQLREMILSGSLNVGDRLPTEAELCAHFQTSRSTIREALRLLSSQSIISTRAGATGGSNITQPQITDIAEFLKTTLSLLAGTSELSIAEVVEARQLLEIPAAGLAAENKGPGLSAELEKLVPADLHRRSAAEIYRMNHMFHYSIVEASGNRMLQLMVDPLFSVLQTRFLREEAGAPFWADVEHDHREIIEAISSGDAAAAQQAMAEHLGHLVPVYAAIDRTQVEAS